ncbi:glycosyltransferase family protein [Adhaeribacter pallidiroseus]|uniref:Glycosyl transferase family 1 domain-containing protein n=1 Tax=Adhaeribacter pallidiroseus TaxID=2072847 RepID=A0A369QMD1_9BACT|nr:glycosyltransferase family 1 protein [Adhaeribacter pallidiroseus]RDC66091.1 hypothetical protein AHMF7616_04722 [Adhaeribacter pallidiroseus]
MRIIFLCGSLEIGRDGVGDYTRRLSGELIHQGHQTAIIALYDKGIKEVISYTQQSEDLIIPVLRIPAFYSSNQRCDLAQKWVDNFNPDWLSLQFVPFAFQSKGLTIGLSKLLKKIGSDRCWHVMFHELWVGMDIQSSIKLKLWGQIQKKIIQSMVFRLKPKLIHTQTRLYQEQLYKIGLDSKYLSLFSNIPVHYNRAPKTYKLPQLKVGSSINFVVFGSIHTGAPIELFTQEASLYAKKKGIKLSLTIIGRSGEEQLHWKTVWELRGLVVEILGEQTPERISEVLSKATFGLSTTPSILIEKSGTVAAMFAHGLPVICISRIWTPRGVPNFKLPNNVVQYKSGNLETCFLLASSPKLFNNVSKITRQLTDTLLSED